MAARGPPIKISAGVIYSGSFNEPRKIGRSRRLILHSGW